VSTAYLYFEFEKSITITGIVPDEGHLSGGIDVMVYGNFSYFFKKIIEVKFGEVLLTSSQYDNTISKDYIVVKVPPSSTEKEVSVFIKYDEVVYKNETVKFYYKRYSSLATITPNYGPSQGGTLITVTGANFDD
jgi:IPT/TIG domain